MVGETGRRGERGNCGQDIIHERRVNKTIKKKGLKEKEQNVYYASGVRPHIETINMGTTLQMRRLDFEKFESLRRFKLKFYGSAYVHGV